MASGDASLDEVHDDASHDPILLALDHIKRIIPGNGQKITKKTGEDVLAEAHKIQCAYLLVLEKLKRLETMTAAGTGCSGGCHRPSDSRKSYSAVLSGSTSKPTFDPLCTLQVYPKQGPNSSGQSLASPEATKRLLQSIDLKNKNIGVKNIKSIRGNGVSILCRDQRDVEALSQVIKDQHDDKLNIKTLSKRDPTMTMLLQGRDYTVADVKEDLLSSNDFLSATNFNVVHTYATKNGNTVFVLQVNPDAFKAIQLNDSKVYVGWTRVTLREQDPITQCFKCQRYGHKASKCHYSANGLPATRCRRCGKQHDDSSLPCTEELCCANCTEYNAIATKRSWSTNDAKHAANDPNCPVRKRAIDRARALINYD